MIFFYDDIKKIIYIIQLIDFETNNKNKIYKFKETFYNFKQFSKI